MSTRAIKRMTPLEAIQLILYFPIWLWHECHSILIKLFVTLVAASVLMPLWDFINEYVYDDWNFFKYFLVVITVDAGFGIWKHWKAKTLCFNTGMKKFIEKFAVCTGTMVIFHVAQNFGAGDDDKSWIDMYVLYLKGAMIFSYIIFDTFLNIYEISGGKYPPPWIMARFKDYDEKGRKVVEALTQDQDKISKIEITEQSNTIITKSNFDKNQSYDNQNQEDLRKQFRPRYRRQGWR